MTETVEQLKARAEKAVALAKEIELLKAAQNEGHTHLRWRTWNTNEEVLPGLLAEVVKAGLRVKIEANELELREILGFAGPKRCIEVREMDPLPYDTEQPTGWFEKQEA